MRSASLVGLVSYGLMIWTWEKNPGNKLLDRLAVPLVASVLLFPLLLFLRLRVLTKIIGDPSLAEYCTIVAWGCGAIVLMFAGFVAAQSSSWLDHLPHHQLEMLGFVFGSILLVSMALFALWATVVLVWCVISLLRATKIAAIAARDWKN